MERWRVSLLSVLCAISILASASCVSWRTSTSAVTRTPISATATKSPTPTASMVLRYGLAEIPLGLDPHIYSEPESNILLNSVYETLTVGAGQMLAFGKGVTHPLAVPLDDAVVRALYIAESAPVLVESDPALLSRVRDELEQLGMPAGKTLFGVLLGAMLAVTCVLLLTHRRRQQ